MQQKLVSVYLIDYVFPNGDAVAEDTGVKEHLNEYLEEGWRVVQMLPLSGTGGGKEIAGWLIVLLERSSEDAEQQRY